MPTDAERTDPTESVSPSNLNLEVNDEKFKSLFSSVNKFKLEVSTLKKTVNKKSRKYRKLRERISFVGK